MIRDKQARDDERLRILHAAAGFDFPYPERMLSAKVWVDSEDKPLMMAGARAMVEAVLISSKEGNPGMRLAMLQALEREVRRDVNAAGITEAVTWVPDEIYRPYSRRLKAMGYKPSNCRTMVYGGGV